MNCFQKLVSLIFGTTATQSITGLAGCELLSEVSIFDIRNNMSLVVKYPLTVVNCFQKLVSLIFGTTGLTNTSKAESCELLSEVSIFDIRNNIEPSGTELVFVVNCFQKLVSLIFGTTMMVDETDLGGL